MVSIEPNIYHSDLWNREILFPMQICAYLQVHPQTNLKRLKLVFYYCVFFYFLLENCHNMQMFVQPIAMKEKRQLSMTTINMDLQGLANIKLIWLSWEQIEIGKLAIPIVDGRHVFLMAPGSIFPADNIKTAAFSDLLCHFFGAFVVHSPPCRWHHSAWQWSLKFLTAF